MSLEAPGRGARGRGRRRSEPPTPPRGRPATPCFAERQERLDAKLDRLEATVGERFAELAAKLDAVAAAARRGEAGT